MKMKQYGQWAFIGGVLLAVLAGFVTTVIPEGIVVVSLALLGLFVGFMNVAQKETMGFLVASLVLLIAGAAGLENLPVVGMYLAPIFTNITTFVAPAAIVVALKTVYELAGEKVGKK